MGRWTGGLGSAKPSPATFLILDTAMPAAGENRHNTRQGNISGLQRQCRKYSAVWGYFLEFWKKSKIRRGAGGEPLLGKCKKNIKFFGAGFPYKV